MGKKKGSRIWWYITGILLLLTVLVLVNVRADIPVHTLSEEYANEYSSFVNIDGTVVHYRDEGEGEPLVLIHGWSASLHTWDDWVDLLKDDFRIIRMDLPAFGLTGPAAAAEQYNQDFYLDFMDKFLTELGVEESYMAGNSLGGLITWGFAHRYPERVNKMILVNAAGHPMEESPSVFGLAGLPGAQLLVRYVTPEFAVRYFMNQIYGDKDKLTREVVRRYQRMILREGNREVLFSVLSDSGDSFDDSWVPDYLKEIKVPTLIIWGDLDRWIPVENAYMFKDDLPNAELIVYEGAGHIIMEEIPEETARDTRSFLLK